jgi:sulfoxide reductase heme-binding subunit YedZ
MARGAGPYPWLKPGVFVGALAPLAAIGLRASRGELGANPIAEAMNQLGLVTLVFLVAALACTPAKILLGWTWPIRLRRMLGLFAFFYAALHLGTYAVLDQTLDWRAILADLTKRRFIYVGFAAFVLLVPLALTSTNASVRRLGYARWKLLHRLAYAAPVLGVVHFTWRVKKDVSEPTTYAIVVGVLLLVRVGAHLHGWLATARAS